MYPPLNLGKGGTMKKFALFAMLLCSCFLVGCDKGKKTDAKPGDAKPGASADDKKGDAGTTTPPVEEKK
jgi:hypothetical protein